MNDNLNLLEKLVDNDGLKMDVAVTLSPEIYFKLFVTITGAVVVSALAVSLMSNVFKN
jgi:hypothetical protein